MTDTKWHWEIGQRYGVEALRTLLLLNGGAAVALLAFLGSKPEAAQVPFGNALLMFGLGALATAIAFATAYLTQLRYGNGEHSVAGRFHVATYLLALLSAALFLVGLFFARRGLTV